jgi:hypothetical protein
LVAAYAIVEPFHFGIERDQHVVHNRRSPAADGWHSALTVNVGNSDPAFASDPRMSTCLD